MYHYLFTNDLRISNLKEVLVEAATAIANDAVPTATEDKNANNNINTLAFYFNLTKNSKCTKACVNGDVRKVVLNFIKKFQFPNPRTNASMKDAAEDMICLSPMRAIIKLLDIMEKSGLQSAYLTNWEIAHYIFFNADVAKNNNPNFLKLANEIIEHREENKNKRIPDDNALEAKGYYWKHCRRQVRELVKVLCWSGCVVENDNKEIRLKYNDLTQENKADLFDIMNYSGFWNPLDNRSYTNNKELYQQYMDIDIIDEEIDMTNSIDAMEQEEKFRAWMFSITKDNGTPYSKKTIYNYINMMKRAYKTYDKYKNYDSIFHIQDVASLDQYTDYLFSEDDFEDFDFKTGKNTCSCALVKYREFLSEIENALNDDKPIAKGGINKIFYGAPGCGKSHHVSQLLKNSNVSNENIIRVTFHPEYANCDFIGQIMPTIDIDDYGKETVKYVFNPGPFSLALLKAYNSTNMIYLIVEEINRGNAAAIFGDMFQLLDRERDTDNPNYSASEYPICNPNMQDYLKGHIKSPRIKAQLVNGVYIPSNLTILATMNSSDQNVFTLDTAFKRRWYFEQISNDILRDNQHSYKSWYVPGTNVTWGAFLTALNSKILDYKIQSQTNEDKRLGKYFVTKECLTERVENISDVYEVAMEFAYKVLEYIWNDVCKIGREEWFDTEEYKTLEELINAFVNPKDGETPLSIFQNINF